MIEKPTIDEGTAEEAAKNVLKDGRVLVRLWDWIDITPIIVISLFLLIILSLAATILAGAQVDFVTGSIDGADPFLLLLYSLAATMLAFLIPYFGMNAIRKRHSFAMLGLGTMPEGWMWPSIGLGIAGALVRMAIGAGLLSMFPVLAEGAEELAELFAFEQTWQMIIVALAASLIVPVYEEIFFRGFIHNATMNRLSSWLITISCFAIFGVIMARSMSDVPPTEFQAVAVEILWGLGIGVIAGGIICGLLQFGLPNRSSMWLTILASSSIFGLFHGFPIQIITAFLFGLIAGWLYEKTNNLWPPIICHITNNGLAMGLSLISIWLGVEL